MQDAAYREEGASDRILEHDDDDIGAEEPQASKECSPTTKGFTVVGDKGVAWETSAWQWCPTMDVLAIATSEPALLLHRLSWQRLSSTSLSRPVTSLAWRHDGTLIRKAGRTFERANLTPDCFKVSYWLSRMRAV